MQIAIPDVNKTLNTLMAVRSTFEDRTQSISDWVMEHRNEMKKNQLLLAVKSPANDIAILNIFLCNLLVRAIKGEMGLRVYEELQTTIKDKADLKESNYRMLLKKANYRWGVDDGSRVISDVVICVNDELVWDWQSYIEQAEKQKENNYQNDPMLRIMNVGFKLRDLALSNFSPRNVSMKMRHLH